MEEKKNHSDDKQAKKLFDFQAHSGTHLIYLFLFFLISMLHTIQDLASDCFISDHRKLRMKKRRERELCYISIENIMHLVKL